MKTKFSLLLIAATSLVYVDGWSINRVSNGSGDWSTPGTWSPSGVPASGDNVTIQNTHTVTYTGNLSRGSSTTTTVNAGGTLNVTGSLTITSGSFVMNGGSVTVGTGLSINGGTYTGTSGSVTITTGNMFVSNSGPTSTNNGATINIQSGSLTVDGTFTNGGTITITNGNATKSNSGGSLTNSGTITVDGTGSNGRFNSNATVSNSGTINTKDFYTFNSGGTFTNTGFVNISGLASVAGTVNLNPGASASSRMTVTGTLTLSGSGMAVGNGTPGSPAKYADLVIQGSMSQTSHTITVNCNGRVAVFGDLNLSGSNPQFNIATCGSQVGGQVYIDGDGSGNTITVTSGAVNNNNANFGSPSTPYGFYVNGSTSGSVDSDRGTLAQMQSTNPTFYSWVASLPNSPLPVVLLYFKVLSIDNSGVNLSWVTTMEKNFGYFSIERAGADLQFVSLGELSAKGGLSVNTSYDFADILPERGYNYYRLKMVDLDGTFEYSKVISANWNLDREVSIYPNPVIENKFKIELNDQLTWPAFIQLSDQMGSIVWKYELNESVANIELPSSIKPGLYYARITHAKGQKIVNLIIR